MLLSIGMVKGKINLGHCKANSKKKKKKKQERTKTKEKEKKTSRVTGLDGLSPAITQNLTAPYYKTFTLVPTSDVIGIGRIRKFPISSDSALLPSLPSLLGSSPYASHYYSASSYVTSENQHLQRLSIRLRTKDFSSTGSISDACAWHIIGGFRCWRVGPLL